MKTRSLAAIAATAVLAVGVASALLVGRHVESQARPDYPLLQGLEVVMYKTPTCACCTAHAEVMEQHGITVHKVHLELHKLMDLRASYGIPASALSCHTTIVEGYAVEGHMPLAAIEKLVRERPQVEAIALPGMPSGSPGMPGLKAQPFEVLKIENGKASLFASY